MDTKWLNLAEAANYLRCTPQFLEEQAKGQLVPFSPLEDGPRFHADKLDEWMFRRERASQSAAAAASQPRAGRVDVPEGDRRILADCDRDSVESILDELIAYNNANEPFVNSLGRELRKVLHQLDYEKLPSATYCRLSKWCDPRQDSPRNRWTKERAHRLSKLLFGRVVERVDS